jgi:hypothetical protein
VRYRRPVRGRGRPSAIRLFLRIELTELYERAPISSARLQGDRALDFSKTMGLRLPIADACHNHPRKRYRTDRPDG